MNDAAKALPIHPYFSRAAARAQRRSLTLWNAGLLAFVPLVLVLSLLAARYQQSPGSDDKGALPSLPALRP